MHMAAARENCLHLNLEGSRVLSNFYLQAVKRMRYDIIFAVFLLLICLVNIDLD